MWIKASTNIIFLGKHPKQIEQGVYGTLHYLHFRGEESKL